MQSAWLTDYANVASIAHPGGKVPELQDLAFRIFLVCVSSGILLELKWISRSVNSEADHLGRIIDLEDYTLQDDIFHMLDFEEDRTLLTASHAVMMRSFPVSIPDFFNRALRLLMLFLQNWHFENNLEILPTVSQIARVIAHLRVCKAEGTHSFVEVLVFLAVAV